MINYRVDDLHKTLARLEADGVEIAGEPEEFEYGKFGWILDPEGNKIELWEPPETVEEGFEPSVPSDVVPGLDGEWACPPGTTVAAAGDLSERNIVKERTVGLPASEIWRLWTTGDGLAEWWAPNNDVELRIGGPMSLLMLPDAPEGQRGSEACRILSFLPEKMLSFTWNAPPNQPYTRPRLTHVVLEFDAVSEERTHVRLNHLGWPEADWEARPDKWQETYDYFENAWGRVLDRLEEHAAQA